MTKSFMLCRLPVTQEDEGRKFYIGEFSSREAAETKRFALVLESKGYYTKGDFQILEQISKDTFVVVSEAADGFLTRSCND